MRQIRYSKLRDSEVIIAPNRLNRPTNMQKTLDDCYTIFECPFEAGNEKDLPKEIFSIKDKDANWLVKVVPNLYNALDIDEKNYSKRDGFFTYKSGFGAHEVIIETPLHDITVDKYTNKMWVNYLKSIKYRLDDLSKDIRLKYIQVFKNHGFKAGATLKHPHSQLIATPFVPIQIKQEFKRCKSYFKTHKRTLLFDMVSEEIREKKRIISQNEDFVAFAPFASLYPFEIIIAPKKDISSVAFLNSDQKIKLAKILQIVYKKLYATLGDFHYNMIFKNSLKDKRYYTFYINIIPRIYTIAGFELSTSMQINPISPELAVEKLNQKALL